MLQRVRAIETLFVIPLTILNQANGTNIKVRALLDSGCSRDLINPVLVMGLELPVHELKDPIIFEQMDVSPMKGKPQHPWEWDKYICLCWPPQPNIL